LKIISPQFEVGVGQYFQLWGNIFQ